MFRIIVGVDTLTDCLSELGAIKGVSEGKSARFVSQGKTVRVETNGDNGRHFVDVTELVECANETTLRLKRAYAETDALRGQNKALQSDIAGMLKAQGK